MNREKYVKNSDYREGYEEGVKESRIRMETFLQMQIDPIIDQLERVRKKIMEVGEKNE